MYAEPIGQLELRGWSPEFWKSKEARDHRGHRIMERRGVKGRRRESGRKRKLLRFIETVPEIFN